MLVLIVLMLRDVCAILHDNGQSCRNTRTFPENFLFGAATSAYQIEGGWNADGKGESMWDHYLHKQPDIVDDLSNGDIAADSYHLYERDVEILKHLGAKSYKFSISWTRILPDGTTSHINPHGIAYYRKLIDLLLANNILPFVTIYHFDLPITLSNQGGWLNATTVDYFGEYARVLFREFGDKVKYWLTVNEPSIMCSIRLIGIPPSLTKFKGIGFFECGRNILLAHARVYHIYDTEFRELQNGKVGLALEAEWPMAASDSKDDSEPVKDYLAFQLGQYLDPILKGDYPKRLSDRIARTSKRQGYPSSHQLRLFRKDQKAYIKGTVDFVGINHYYSLYVSRNDSVINMFEQLLFDDDAGVGSFSVPTWSKSESTRKVNATGLYSLLMYLKTTYDNPEIYITETGLDSTSADDLNDDKKANYLRNYLNALLDAKAAGSNCQGYFFWSLLDGLEWTSGYDKHKFGLYKVDFSDPHRTRTPRKSALVYKKIIQTRTIDFNYNPDPYQYQYNGTKKKYIAMNHYIGMYLLYCFVILMLF